MASRLNPDLSFRDNARDAMEFYRSVLGGELEVMTFGHDTDRLRGFFAGLAQGGAVRMPLEMQRWGDEFAMLTDKYGVGWIVDIAGEAAGAAS